MKLTFRDSYIPFISFFALVNSFVSHADQLIQDDLVIKGSMCVGLDCVNGENFNYDTIRLKENNVRIKFIDSSSSSSFPTVDWELVANDSTNGGLNRFSIANVDKNTTPFTIIDGAPSNSLYVRDNGWVGLGTGAPQVQLHVVGNNSPALRLEQTTGAGFAAQSWDVTGNETSFFVRDVTSGGRLPFRIETGATNGSIYVASDGDVGLKTTTPDGQFDVAHSSNANNHAFLISPTSNVGVNIDNGYQPNALFEVQRTGGISNFAVQSDGDVGIGTATPTGRFDIRNLANTTSYFNVTNAGNVGVGNNNPLAALDIRSNNDNLVVSAKNPSGAAWIAIENGNLNVRQLLQSNNEGGFSVTREDLSGGGGNYIALLISDSAGNLTIPGTLNEGSNFHNKENIMVIKPHEILTKLQKLDISTWNYKKDGKEVSHIGPMAQDFFELFGFGQGDTSIASVDANGVAFAAIQAIYIKLLENQKEITALKNKIQEQ